MGVFRKTSDVCLACEHYDDCNNKLMVACAFIETPPPMLASAAEKLTSPLAQNAVVKHDYRDIWIDEQTTVTIDMEDVKKQIEREFYKAINLPWLNYGA